MSKLSPLVGLIGLHPPPWVADILHLPLETPLPRLAHALGCRTLDGGGMAVLQAVEALRLFTGAPPDAQCMMRHFAELGAEPGGDTKA